MKPHSIIVVTATALLLGSASLAPAQDRGGDRGGPAAQSERGAGRDDGGQGQERGSRASKRDEGAQKGSAERGGRSAEQKGDRGGERRSSAREKGGPEASGRDAKEAREKSDRGGKEARDRDAKEARDKSDRGGRDAKEARDKRDRDAREARDRREQDAKGARDRRDRDAKEAREGRDKDRDGREARERIERDGSAATGATSDRAGTGESGRREARDRDRDRDRDRLRDVQLTDERRTRVREVFRREDVRELRDVDFRLSIGTHVPRRIELYPIPAAVIDIVPQYRGYRYFVVHDEIVIVEPDTYEIVYVIDERGHARAGGGGGACDELALTDEERRLIIRTIEIDRFRDEHGIRVSVGERLPARLELHAFPDAVIREVSKVRSCRFTVIDGDITIVDPDERQVVVRLEK